MLAFGGANNALTTRRNSMASLLTVWVCAASTSTTARSRLEVSLFVERAGAGTQPPNDPRLCWDARLASSMSLLTRTLLENTHYLYVRVRNKCIQPKC
jgi:hypothetical protein